MWGNGEEFIDFYGPSLWLSGTGDCVAITARGLKLEQCNSEQYFLCERSKHVNALFCLIDGRSRKVHFERKKETFNNFLFR